MVAALRDLEALRFAAPGHTINEAMFARNPARPETRELPAQWLWASGSGERMAAALLNQAVQPRPCLSVVRSHIKIVGPG